MKKCKPEPVPVNIVCSLCGEPWHAHAKDTSGDVTTLECIRLLKARLDLHPMIVTYPVHPRPWPRWDWCPGTINVNDKPEHYSPLTLTCTAMNKAEC